VASNWSVERTILLTPRCDIKKTTPPHSQRRATTAPYPPASRPAHLAPHRTPSFDSTRQGASAFNQPLSFDTSSVTDMYRMFYVRSARALAPKP